jgi:N-methylhydantoinase B
LDRGNINQNVFNLLMNNVRSPKETGGDLRAQVAGVKIGILRLIELIGKFGLETITQSFEQLLDYTEQRVRDEFAKIPTGVYEAEDYMDGDGISEEPVKVAVKITVSDEKVTFDLTGSAPQCEGPINSTYACTLSCCAYALRVLMAPDLPVNDGFYRLFKVIAPEGTVVNAKYPSPVGGCWETGNRVTETAMQAFAKRMPERMAAGSKGCFTNIAFGGISPRSGEYFMFYESICGGYGARATKDGIDGVQAHGQNTENTPVEETEASYPVEIIRFALIPDSEGAGRWRGGLGVRRDYRFYGKVVFSVLADRCKFQPWGLQGGQSARGAKFILHPDTDPKELPSKFSISLQPGDIFSVQMGGGGGYGAPDHRNPASVLADVQAGKISLERARNAYGVAVNPDMKSYDPDATEHARKAIRGNTN